ncbi:hypothetical protein GGI07_005817 [Coemansia sp. Benny D115]|nr:hypothetical protein GGI07_005817 [Coemansia sp. Benny D115]
MTTASPPALPPDDPQLWTVDDVHRWAAAQPLIAAVAPVLREHKVDGHVLIHYIKNAVLADELGITAFGTRVYVLEAIETLRWQTGLASHRLRASSLSQTPEESPPRSLKDEDEMALADEERPGRSASRVADAEKKRQKRAELKKNPVLYAEYLQKERERNARRRARLRAERGRSNSSGNAHDFDIDDGALARAYDAQRPFAVPQYAFAEPGPKRQKHHLPPAHAA